MRSPEPGDAPGTPPGPPSPIFLILVCPPETLPSPGFASTFCLSGGGLKRPQPSRGRSARRWGPMLLVLPAPAVKKAAAVRSRWPRPLSAAAVPWQLAAVNAAASFLQCAGPLGRGTRHGPASGNASCCPAAPLPGWKQRGSSPACSTLPALPPEPRTLPLSSSRGYQPWLVRCSRSLGTAGAGSSKFTVCLDDVAQTQHVIERFGLRSRVYIPEKTVRNNHQRHKAFTRI